MRRALAGCAFTAPDHTGFIPDQPIDHYVSALGIRATIDFAIGHIANQLRVPGGACVEADAVAPIPCLQAHRSTDV